MVTSNVTYSHKKPFYLSLDAFTKIKKPSYRRFFLRQLSRLSKRPAAFRPPLTKGLALSGFCLFFVI